MSKPMSRDERIRAVMAEAITRDRQKREAAAERAARGSAGLPPRGVGIRTSSVVTKPRYR
ncbi:hypothetical protein C1N80_06355 [Brachybacterium sp. SGAir0954]|uniref:hypothetical protein n=1 Tax=Brachybacterium sp. SGAir0954 TaxID=2571029 RepID=UPI0010CCFD05|nr:hypothetical protein [Brachybacterium sp. SGAir0954]QCR53242.1 hypothetical protein C1N80_06355 [Brachybacterium sp. SGAir0954]